MIRGHYAKPTVPASALRGLVDACKMLRDSAGHRSDIHSHIASQEVWSAWCKQIKFAEKALTEAKLLA